METIIRIDTQIVRQWNSGAISNEPVHYYAKRHPGVCIDNLPYAYEGSRRLDSLLIQRIMSGSVKIEDLVLVLPSYEDVVK